MQSTFLVRAVRAAPRGAAAVGLLLWPSAQLLVGIDASPGMIERARGKHPDEARFRFDVGDASAIPLESGSADLVLSTVSFHHWPDQAGALHQVARVLNPGGVFVLADIRPPLLLRPLMRRFHARRARRKLFEEAGLIVIGQGRPLRLGGNMLVTVARKR